MARTYRISSPTINFSLVVPDHVTEQEVTEEAREVGLRIAQQQRTALQSGPTIKASITLVNDEEEEDGPTMLGRLCAEYYHNQP